MTSPATSSVPDAVDIAAFRKDFPTLDQEINGYPLVYLDNAASSQPAQAVIDEIARYQSEDHANVHRGIHTLSHRATDLYEQARERVRRFLNAAESREVVFTRGTTESINLVAASYGREQLGPGDAVLLTELEHHSNIVPWQVAAEAAGAEVRVAPVDDAGEVHADAVIELMDERVKIVALAHVSNVLGTILPVEDIIAAAHARGIPVLLDGAQAVPHTRVDVRELDVDFYAFSGHKLFGPTGSGVLYGKAQLLGAMPPYQGGGAMIDEVRFEGTTYNELPYRFEAGTPNISGAIGLGVAARYLSEVGMRAVEEHVDGLLEYLTENLEERPDVRLIGTANKKASVQSFLLGDVHPHDLGTILDQQGVAVRTGHHCAMPLMRRYGIPGTVRASLALYNNRDDVDRFLTALDKARQIFAT